MLLEVNNGFYLDLLDLILQVVANRHHHYTLLGVVFCLYIFVVRDVDAQCAK